MSREHFDWSNRCTCGDMDCVAFEMQLPHNTGRTSKRRDCRHCVMS